MCPLHWESLARGYWGVAKFQKANEDWSVKVFQDGNDFSMEFLVPEAPHEVLERGSKFELREGRHVVAHGIIFE